MANDPVYYFDFSKKGQDLLGKRDVPVLKNVQAIKESVINLLSTEVGERPMRPEYGTSLDRFLFEPLDEITADIISYEIEKAIGKFEPRVTNLEIYIEPDYDLETFIINISFDIVYTGGKEVLELDFKKIR